MVQALLYFVAIVLIITAAFGPPVRVNLGLLGAGVALLGFAFPTMTTAV